MTPWSPSRDTLELFAVYLRVSGAFVSPSTYWWANVDESRQRRCDFRLDRDWAKCVIAGVERDLAAQEQAEPLTVPILRRLGAVVATNVYFNTVLGLVCALFTPALVGTFPNLGPDDIQDDRGGKVRVLLSKLKGERRQPVLDPVFERLPAVRVSSAPFGPTLGSSRCVQWKTFGCCGPGLWGQERAGLLSVGRIRR